MSEETKHPGAPIGTQRSGSNGERRDGGADELSPQGEVSERSASQRVSRETENPSPQGEVSERSASQRVSRETENPPQKNKRSSFYVYLVILFGAAFLMLLLAYFVQQRNNETTISGLQDSWNLSRDELMEKNEELEVRLAVMEDQRDRANNEIDELDAQLYEFQTLYDGATDTVSHLEHVLTHRTEAMELFYQLDRAYAQGKTQQCLELIEYMEKPEGGPLKDFLPTEDDRSEYSFGMADGAAPAERYQEIFDKLSEIKG